MCKHVQTAMETKEATWYLTSQSSVFGSVIPHVLNARLTPPELTRTNWVVRPLGIFVCKDEFNVAKFRYNVK